MKVLGQFFRGTVVATCVLATAGSGDKFSWELSQPLGCPPLPGVQGLRAAADKKRFSWSSAAGVTGYDGARQDGGGGGDACVAPDTADTFFDDTTVPAVGAMFVYFVRTRDGTCTGSYGQDSSGAERTSTACP